MSSSKRKIETISSTSSDEVFEYKRRGQTVPKDIVSVKFHPSIIEVEEYAFRRCKQLREVILNDGLREIGEEAFEHCESLQSITLPSSVTEIDVCAFYGCINLREVVLRGELKEISRSVFAFCSTLQSITIPSSVSEICDFAFHSCRDLREVELNDGIKRIKQVVFQNCESLQSIIIPFAVEEIGSSAFSGCTGLREVVLHNEGVQIRENAFENCISLQRFKFPSLWTRLDNVIQAGQTDIEAKMDDISAVEWRSGEISILPVIQERENRWGIVETAVEVDEEKLKKVEGLIRYYEIKEAATLFELALWKAKIDQVDDTDINNRDMYRVEVPGPVKDRVLQYIGYNTNV